MSISPSYVDGLELRIKELGEQVEKLKAELKSIDGALNDPRANLTLTTSEIIWELKGQVEKLTKERDDLTKTLELMEHTRDIEQIQHREMMSEKREQLAALAEQNEKYREALFEFKKEAEHYGETWARAHIADYDRIATDSQELRFRLLGIAQDRLKAVGEALSLHDLASPVLNRIRAEGIRMAAELISEDIYLAARLRARADELEKTND